MFQLFKSLVTTQALGDSPSLGGVFTDPNHFQKGTFAGLRMITDNQGDAPSNTITLLGSDDGAKVWQLKGAWTDKEFGKMVIDFSPKGGPSDLTGTFSCDPECKITW